MQKAAGSLRWATASTTSHVIVCTTSTSSGTDRQDRPATRDTTRPPSGETTLKEFLWNFDDFLCLSRPGVEASQYIVFNSVSPYVLTDKNRSFNFAKILIF